MTEFRTFRYRAFISYSHADERWAQWLHRSLETYRVPKHLVGTKTRMGEVPPRLAPVFRDRDELASSTDLGAELREALDQSACQIVICSRAAAQSHWVNEEILAYKRLGRSGRIFCLIVDGEPYASGLPGSESDECFPEALRYVMGDDGELTTTPAEPIAADCRAGKDGKSNAKIKLIAGLLGLGFDALRQRELQRRHRRMAAVAGFSTLGMVLAIGLATSAFIARNEAERQRVRAEKEAETARQTSSFLVSLFEVSDPGEARGRSITAREILTAGAARIETELGGQPAVQTRLMTTIGRVYTRLGLYGDASELLGSALARRRQLPTLDARELSDSLLGLGEVKTRVADFDDAEALYRETLQTLRDGGQENSPEMADALAGLAEVYFQTGRYSEAEPVLREVLEHRRRNLERGDPAIADAIEELGLNQYDQGDYAEAEERLREALSLRRESLGDAPHPDVAENLNNLGLVLMESEQFEESEALYEEALTMYRRLHARAHPDIALVLNNLGQLYRAQDRLANAERNYRAALATQRESLGENHPATALVLSELAFLEYDQEKLEEAIDYTRRALAVQEAAFGQEHPEVAATMARLGRWLGEAGLDREAEALLREAVAKSTRLLDPGHPDIAIARLSLAATLSRMDGVEEAHELAGKALPTLEDVFGADHWITAIGKSIRGDVLRQLGDAAAAEPLLVSSYERLSTASGARPIHVRRALSRLIALYENTDRAELAGVYRGKLAAIELQRLGD